MPRLRDLGPCGLAVAALLVATGEARAQGQYAVSVGASVTTYNPSDPLAANAAKVGPLIRLRTEPGLGPSVGFEWFQTNAHTTLTGERRLLGRLRVRPFMAGAKYAVGRGPWELQGSLVAGWAFVGLNESDRTRDAYRDHVGGSFVSIEAAGSFAWRARVSVWYDVSPRVGVMAGLAYLNVRPRIDLASDRGTDSLHYRLNPVILTVGIAYGVF